MPTDHFSTTTSLATPPADVHAFLSDPHSYVGLAPLVVEVRDIRVTGASTRYVAAERFRFGPFHWDNAIDVTMTFPTPLEVVSSVRSPGWVRLTSTVTLTPTEAGCTLVESVELHTPWFLRSYALRKAREAQAGRITGLQSRF
ncbi:SRPBCC family protein [Actinoplanes sp. NPDC089786]|uniref:SRPBCC family protein n=1 Tax=Actinoplanes sp. NPDC089786 TaxID=3155185 RepID=UPI003435B2C8